jgi:hypothetical protein
VWFSSVIYHHIFSYLYFSTLLLIIDAERFEFMAAGRDRPMAMMAMADRFEKQPHSTGGLKQVKQIRTEFPETWLWTNATTGYSVILLGCG